MNAAHSTGGWRSLFGVAFNLSTNPMILLQRDRVLVDVNGAFVEAFGYARARALGCKLDVFIAEDSRRRMKKDWWEPLRTGRLNGHRELIRGDGGHVRVQFAAHRAVVPVASSSWAWCSSWMVGRYAAGRRRSTRARRR